MSATVIINVLSGEQLHFYVKGIHDYENLTDELARKAILEEKSKYTCSYERAKQIALSNEQYSRTVYGIHEYYLTNPELLVERKETSDSKIGGAGCGSSVSEREEYQKRIMELESRERELRGKEYSIDRAIDKRLTKLEDMEDDLKCREGELCKQEEELCKREEELHKQEQELCKRQQELRKQEEYLSLGMILSTCDLTQEDIGKLIRSIQMSKIQRKY